MFCEKCGRQNADGAMFCENCGAQMQAPAAPVAPVEYAAPAAPQYVEPQYAAPQYAAPVAAPAAPAQKASIVDKLKAIHQKNKLIFPIAGAVVAVVIALIILFSILGKQVSMKNYMNITVEGYDGYGTMSYDFGDVTFGLRACGDKDSKEYKERKDNEHFLSYDREDVSKDYRKKLEDAQDLVESIEITCEMPEGKSSGKLSNGDVVKFTIKVDEELAKELGLTIKNTSFEYTIEGLKPLAQFDVFSYFDLKGEGYDGYGKIKLECNQSGSKTVGDLTFEMEAGSTYVRYTDKDGYNGSVYVYLEGDTYNKSNGDKVMAKIDVYKEGFVSYGVGLTAFEKEYTVEGLKETEKVDLLEYYTVEFTGLNESGRPKATPTQETVTIGEYEVNLTTGDWYKGDERVGYTSVYFSDTYGLTNGDKIKFYVSFSEYTFSELGIKFINNEKELTVENLAAYVGALADIKDNTEVDTNNKQIITDWLNDSWSLAVHNRYFGSYSNQSIGEDLTLYKTVLTTPKSTSSYDHNDLWMIYSVTLNDNVLAKPTTCYIALRYNDAAVYVDGSLYLGNSASKYGGYTSYDALYTALIDSYNLNIEVSE